MSPTFELAADARSTTGVLLLTLVAVEYGGTSVLKLARGSVPATDLQRSFSRAGHAHAGVLVVLGVLAQLLVSATDLDGVWRVLATKGVPLAAILLPAGFFLSVVGRDVHRPNRLIVLVWLGAASLAVGLVALGVGLLLA